METSFPLFAINEHIISCDSETGLRIQWLKECFKDLLHVVFYNICIDIENERSSLNIETSVFLLHVCFYSTNVFTPHVHG